MKYSTFLPAFGIVALAACTGNPTGTGDASTPPFSLQDTSGVALNDMIAFSYKGFDGGLYPGRGNTMPAEHARIGMLRARAVQALDANGSPSPNGKYVLLSVGMSNTSDEFCGVSKTTACDVTTFIPATAVDPSVNHSTLVIVNGAQGGQDAVDWDSPADPTYDRARQLLGQLGVTEKQVQVVWLKQADASPTTSLPAQDADGYRLEKYLGDILRALKLRYPNVRQVFLSSRTYGGYATSQLNPEPYAYESGFAVKWVIQAQIEQMQLGQVADPRAGDLNYDSAAPWIAWGPYLWANGMTPRSDGLMWARSDFVSDGTHPSPSGAQKVAAALLAFFKSSPQTRCWFVNGGVCG